MHWCNLGWFCSSTGVESIFQGSILLWSTNVKKIRNSDICSLAICNMGNTGQDHSIFSATVSPIIILLHIIMGRLLQSNIRAWGKKYQYVCAHVSLCRMKTSPARNLLSICNSYTIEKTGPGRKNTLLSQRYRFEAWPHPCLWMCIQECY